MRVVQESPFLHDSLSTSREGDWSWGPVTVKNQEAEGGWQAPCLILITFIQLPQEPSLVLAGVAQSACNDRGHLHAGKCGDEESAGGAKVKRWGHLFAFRPEAS